MKIYIFHNSITFVGKAWEVRAKLKDYQKKFNTVSEIIDTSYQKKNKLQKKN